VNSFPLNSPQIYTLVCLAASINFYKLNPLAPSPTQQFIQIASF
jgi:hypothetical protein